ncbi:MAG TPA: prolyl oligopeptidase family serine peptidase [Phycisphaerales bacterium]|nr:prolyl oligopeptidase family serine peptidase [Phycisphaerales bacterium]
MSRPLLASFVLWIGALATAVALPGCTTFQPADPSRARSYAAPAPLAATDWPARKTDNLEALCAATPKAIYSLVVDGSPSAKDLPEEVRRVVNRPAARIAYCGVHGPGLLRVFQSRRADSDRAGVMRFVSYSTRSDLPVDPRFTKYAERRMRELAGRAKDLGAEVRPADAGLLAMLTEGTAIRLVEPSGKTPIRGTIVYMSGLGSIPYEQAIADELSARGWWLVRIATPRVWWYESKPWYVGSREDVPRVARQLAGVLDDLVAEPAYAAQAVLDYLAEARPEVPQHPLAIVGFSAGSLAAPAIVARTPERFDAAVIVGGGANLLEISQKSDLTDGGIRLAWPDNQPRGDWREQLFRDYLTFSKLDPYHTARFLRNKPVLTVLANLDLTVPAANGWLLWDRLGRPDSYNHVGEHRTLFFTLHGQARRIADWLENATEHLRRDPVAHAPGLSSPALPQPQ